MIYQGQVILQRHKKQDPVFPVNINAKILKIAAQ